jgi:hypothetical protein
MTALAAVYFKSFKPIEFDLRTPAAISLSRQLLHGLQECKEKV